MVELVMTINDSINCTCASGYEGTLCETGNLTLDL